MNTTEYMTALENFIRKFQSLHGVDPEQISEILADICCVLRIGRVEVLTEDSEAVKSPGALSATCFYDSKKAVGSGRISKNITAIDEMVAVFNIYPIEGETEWTDEERNRIDLFITVFSTFVGKFRFISMAHRMAYCDSDFDMYNLRYFMKCTQTLCRSGQVFGLTAVRFNLKHFSVVNQYIGRASGTLVMKKFIDRVQSLIGDENELLCRIGGDNFLMLIKSDKLQSVLDVLDGTGIIYDEVRGERVFITATAGVYVIKDIGRAILPTDIMDRVSLAAQLAKHSPKTDVVYFDEALLERRKHNNDISASFPRALEEREFLVYYQPKVAIDGRHIAGAEALCRWIHNGQMISPGEFIPVLEQGLDICKLDFYVLDAVCRDIRRWLDSGRDVVRVSINFSRRHLSDSDLLEHIIEVIDRNDVPHKYIEIELTETTTDVEFKDLKHIIGGLQQAGISASVDDFGVGYSSLNLIKEIPWNVLKLDMSLLPAEGDENAVQKSVMFKYIVAMAQEMGLECISEGVETKEQVQLLAENKCNLAQGFYFDRPLTVEEFETRLDKNFVYDR